MMPNSSNNDLTYAVQSTPLSVLGKLTVTACFCKLWLQFRSSSLLEMCLYTGQLWLRPAQVTPCRQLGTVLWKTTRLLQFDRKY